MRTAILFVFVLLGSILQASNCPCRNPSSGLPNTSVSGDYENWWACVASDYWSGVPELLGQNLIEFRNPPVMHQLFDKTVEWYSPCDLENRWFPPTLEYCAAHKPGPDEPEIYRYWGQTASENGKVIIPYCYGMREIHLYRVAGLGDLVNFQWIGSVPLPRPIESIKFFGDVLVVADEAVITLYQLAGLELRKLAEHPFPHGPQAVACGQPLYSYVLALNQDDYVYADGILYVLIPWDAPDLGVLLTLKLEGDQLVPVYREEGAPRMARRGGLHLNEFGGARYLMYVERESCVPGGHDGFANLFTLNGLRPEFMMTVDHPAPYSDSFWQWAAFKNDLLYIFGFSNRSNPPPVCPYTTEVMKWDSGTFTYLDHMPDLWGGPVSDTQIASYAALHIACKDSNELPEVSFTILPTIGVSGNFLVGGEVSAAEGVHRVFSGWSHQLPRQLFRAELYPSGHGTQYWMAKVDLQGMRYEGDWPTCEDGSFALFTVAEDEDGDPNNNFDQPLEDVQCVTLGNSSNTLPQGMMETVPAESDAILEFSGRASDDSGVRVGWVLSEEAEAIVRLDLEDERPLQGKVPSSHGRVSETRFHATYDTAGLRPGTYEFTVRILANDFQVLDFGPYTVRVSPPDGSHGRPAGRP